MRKLPGIHCITTNYIWCFIKLKLCYRYETVQITIVLSNKSNYQFPPTTL